MGDVSGVLNVVLLGKTGAGKSLSGNTILGRRAFSSKKSSSTVTLGVAVESGAVEGFPVTVYDTTGLSEMDMSDEEIQQMINEKVLQKCASGLWVFLLVIRADRFTEEERKTVEMIEKILGENNQNNIWILFTRGDKLEGGNTTIQQFIEETEELKTLVQKYEHRYHVFNNRKEEETSEQVKMLFTKMIIRRVTMRMEAGMEASSTIQNPEATHADSLPSVRIVLLGKTGAGKSASANTILGQKEFRSELSLSSVTSACSVKHSTASGRSVSVVDTPGFFDTQMTPEELMMEIARCVYFSSPGPHAFLIVLRIDERFTEHEQQIPQMMEKMFGEGVLKYSIVLFTRGDLLDGESIEKLIRQNRRLRSLVQQCEGRYQLFNNRDEENREQVEDLLQKIDSMIQQNGGAHYTNQMYEDALKFRQAEKKGLREVNKRQTLRALFSGLELTECEGQEEIEQLGLTACAREEDETERLIPRYRRLRLIEQRRKKEERPTLRLIERVREEAELMLRMIKQLREEERDTFSHLFDLSIESILDSPRNTLISRVRIGRMMEEAEEMERPPSRVRIGRMMEEAEEMERPPSRVRIGRMMEKAEEMERPPLRVRIGRMMEKAEEMERPPSRVRIGRMMEKAEEMERPPLRVRIGRMMEEAEEMESLRSKLITRCSRMRLIERVREEVEELIIQLRDEEVRRTTVRLIGHLRKEGELTLKMIEQLRVREKEEMTIEELKLASREMRLRPSEQLRKMLERRGSRGRISSLQIPQTQITQVIKTHRPKKQTREEEEVKVRLGSNMPIIWLQLRKEEEMERPSSIERSRLIEQVRQKVELTLSLIRELRDMEEE